MAIYREKLIETLSDGTQRWERTREQVVLPAVCLWTQGHWKALAFGAAILLAFGLGLGTDRIGGGGAGCSMPHLPGCTGPTPSPGPGPQPAPSDQFRVLVVYDQSSADKLTYDIVGSNAAKDIVAQAKGQLRNYPQGTDVTNDGKWFQQSMALAKELPWMVVGGPKGGYSGKLPATLDAYLALLRQYSPSSMVTITDKNYRLFVPGGQRAIGRRHGMTRPRDFAARPYGSIPGLPRFEDFNIPLIPKDQQLARAQELAARKDRLSDIRFRAGWHSLDQDGFGYCWAHSGVSAHMYLAEREGQPHVDLSAFMVAAIIKGGRDEGGNGIDGVEFQAKNGVCPQALWPQGSANLKYDTPAMRAVAAKYKVQYWADLGEGDECWERTKTCLLLRIPVVVDYNWWSHSVCAVDLVDMDTVLIQNSWGDSWSDRGTGQLQGGKARPDNAVACIGVAGVDVQTRRPLFFEPWFAMVP